MPREITLVCDRPRCRNEGYEHRIDDCEVILCDDDFSSKKYSLAEVKSWGRPLEGVDGHRRPRKSATSRDTIRSLIVDDGRL